MCVFPGQHRQDSTVSAAESCLIKSSTESGIKYFVGRGKRVAAADESQLSGSRRDAFEERETSVSIISKQSFISEKKGKNNI